MSPMKSTPRRTSAINKAYVGSLDLPICKKCKKRIKKDEPREWLTKPMGLSHIEPCPKEY